MILQFRPVPFNYFINYPTDAKLGVFNKKPLVNLILQCVGARSMAKVI